MVYLLLALSLWLLITRPKKGILSCGLFGFAGNREIDEKILNNLKILGLFNQARGEDSCGYYAGEGIEKGIDEESKFFNFVIKERVKLGKGKVFIGHTRKKTHGGATYENAHPFLIENPEDPDKGELILAHNGQIHNVWTLCYENDLDASKILVDSKGLAALINKKGFSILEEYKGAAALLMNFTNEPDSLYIYHGFSRDFEAEKDGKEERPLFYLMAEEGIYISSLKHSLEWINGKADDTRIKIVPHNSVLKLTNGVQEKEYVKIDRSRVFTKEEEARRRTESARAAVFESSYPAVRRSKIKGVNITAKALVIENETYPNSTLMCANHTVYFHKGRYWDSTGEVLLNGKVYVSKQRTIVEDNTGSRTALCYFFNGVLLHGEKEWLYLQNEFAKPHSPLNTVTNNPVLDLAKYISNYSRYPVTNIDKESARAVTRDVWWHKGKIANNGAITPVFADRNYFFCEGNLTKISGNSENESPFFLDKKALEIEAQKEDKKKTDRILKKSTKYEYPKEIIEAAGLYRKVYSSYDEAEAAFSGTPWFALEAYAEDVLTMLMKTEPTPDLVSRIVDELLYAASFQSTTIEELMDGQLSSPEQYLMDAYNEWAGDSSEKGEDCGETCSTDETKKRIFEIVDGDKVTAQTQIPYASGTFEVEDIDELVPTESGEVYDKDKPIEDQLVYDIHDDFLKEEEKDEAIANIEEILGYAKEIMREVEEMKILSSCDFAIEASNEVEQFMDVMKSTLKDLAMKYKMTGLSFKINQAMKQSNVF